MKGILSNVVSSNNFLKTQEFAKRGVVVDLSHLHWLTDGHVVLYYCGRDFVIALGVVLVQYQRT